VYIVYIEYIVYIKWEVVHSVHRGLFCILCLIFWGKFVNYVHSFHKFHPICTQTAPEINQLDWRLDSKKPHAILLMRTIKHLSLVCNNLQETY